MDYVWAYVNLCIEIMQLKGQLYQPLQKAMFFNIKGMSLNFICKRESIFQVLNEGNPPS